MNELGFVQLLISQALKSVPENNRLSLADWLTKILTPSRLFEPTGDVKKETDDPRLAQKIYRSLLVLENDITLRVLPGKQQDHLRDDLTTLNKAFEIKWLSRSAQDWRNLYMKDLEYVSRSLEHLEPIYEVERAINAKQIRSSIHDIRQQALESKEISDHDRSVISACLELVESAFNSLERGQLGEFRQNIYTAAGRISLEVVDDGSDKVRIRKMKEFADNVLRIAGLIEITGAASGLIPWGDGIAGLIE